MFTIEANSLRDIDRDSLTTYTCYSKTFFNIKREPIDTIPEAMWWAITTVTTVGYGDTIPLSFGGKLLGLFALLFGVIVSIFFYISFILFSLYLVIYNE